MSQDAPASSGYAGLVTRAVALLVDAAVIDVMALLAGGAATLIASLFGHKGSLSVGAAVLGGFAWVLWSALYFVTFWSLTGQTPGDRMLGIRVMTATGGRIRIRVAVPRFVGLLLCLIPLGAGFLPVLFDDRRRGLHDRLAGTVVRWQEAGPPSTDRAGDRSRPQHQAGQSLPA